MPLDVLSTLGMPQSEWKERRHGAYGSVLVSGQTSTFAMWCFTMLPIVRFLSTGMDEMQRNSCCHFSTGLDVFFTQLPSVRSTGARVQFDRPPTSGAVPQKSFTFLCQSGSAVPQHSSTAVPSSLRENHSSTSVVAGSPQVRKLSSGRSGAQIGRRAPNDSATTLSVARGSHSVA